MNTCYDCIHCEACSDAGDSGYSCLKEDVSKCKNFKNKADFVEVKHGKWIYNVKYYSCSVCAGKRFNLLLGTDAEYCPYCGAKMYEEPKNDKE